MEDSEGRRRENDYGCSPTTTLATRRTRQQTPPESTGTPEDEAAPRHLTHVGISVSWHQRELWHQRPNHCLLCFQSARTISNFIKTHCHSTEPCLLETQNEQLRMWLRNSCVVTHESKFLTRGMSQQKETGWIRFHVELSGLCQQRTFEYNFK